MPDDSATDKPDNWTHKLGPGGFTVGSRTDPSRALVRIKANGHGDSLLFQILQPEGREAMAELIRTAPDLLKHLPLIDADEMMSKMMATKQLMKNAPPPGDDETGYVPITVTNHWNGHPHILYVRGWASEAPKAGA